MPHRLTTARVAILLATAGLAAAVPAAASAAPGDFGPPLPLRSGGATSLPGDPSITLNADGLGVAVSDVGGSGVPGPHFSASAFTNGVFLDPFTFSGGTTRFGPSSGGVAAYAHTGLLSAGLHATTKSTQAVLAIGRLSADKATLGTVRAVGPTTMFASAPALAVDAKGDAAMVVPVCRDGGCNRSLIYLVTRRAGSSHLTTTRVAEATRTLPRVAAAINARGDALAVWTDNEDVDARIRTLGGTLRATQRVGATQRGSLASPSASLSLHRAELVGWSTQVVHEGDPTAGEVRAGQARDGGRFTSVPLSTLPALSGQSVVGAVVEVAFDPAGVRHLAWTGYDGTAAAGRHFTVSSALLHGGAGSGTATLVNRRVVSDPAVDTILDDLDTITGGAELITMRAGLRGDEPVDGHTVVQVASRPSANAAFTRTTLSSPDELATSAHAALLPGRAVVVWGTATAGARYAERVTPAVPTR
jgi:hypothetical protein